MRPETRMFPNYCHHLLMMVLVGVVGCASQQGPQGTGSKVERADTAASNSNSNDTFVSKKRLALGEATILTVGVSFPTDTVFRWNTRQGTIAGKGLRVNFIPRVAGIATIQFSAEQGGKVIARRRFSVQVDPGGPQLMIDRIFEEDDGRMIVHGHTESLSNPEEYNVAVYVHGDVYYKARDRHVFKLNYEGRFAFSVDISPVIDRMVVHLIRREVNPDAPEGCQNAWQRIPGQCNGHFNKYGLRVPLKAGDDGSLAVVVHHFLGKNEHSDKQIQNLLNRFVKIPMTGGASSARLVRSYLTSDKLHLYDQALAVLAFTHAGERAAAKRVLDALQTLQIRDGSAKEGSWYAAYLPDGTRAQLRGDPRIAGSISWVAMALNAYRMKFKDKSYDGMWHRVMNYLASELMPASFNGKEFRAVRYQANDSEITAWVEPAVLSVEHNLDVYSAFRFYAQLSWQGGVRRLRGRGSCVLGCYVDSREGAFLPRLQFIRECSKHNRLV